MLAPHNSVAVLMQVSRSTPEGYDRADFFANLHELLLRSIIWYVADCN
jgi:hypothetical protein